MAKVLIALGSNMGDRKGNIERAIELMRARGINIQKAASMYETAPVGYTDQGWFVNTVVSGETDLSPEALLEVLQSIESELLRVKKIHWGPRTIDLDILFYDDLKMATEKLIIPHPRIKERAFVLIPLLELEPNFVLDGEDLSFVAKTLLKEQEVIGKG